MERALASIRRIADIRQIDMADGPSLHAKKREGVVFKSLTDPNIQFKCISNEWLLDNGE